MRVVTTATETGYKAIPGADHKRPTYHFKMTPGTAYKRNAEGTYDVVQVDAKLCKQAKQAFMLFWIEGRTVTEFHVGNDVYAQPVVPDPEPKRKRAKGLAVEGPPPRKALPEPKREAPGVAPPAPAAEPERAAGKAPSRAAAKPPPEPREPRAKGLRKKGYSLDF